MAWNLSGSYIETCSCELMCPCNLSLDHGATYDFCRVVLVFNLREGQIEGEPGGGRGRGQRGGAAQEGTPAGLMGGGHVQLLIEAIFDAAARSPYQQSICFVKQLFNLQIAPLGRLDARVAQLLSPLSRSTVRRTLSLG